MGNLGAHYLWLASEVGGSPDWACNCGILRCLQVGSVRIELNHRTLSWCHRELLGVGKPPHPWCQKCCVVVMGRVKEKHRRTEFFHHTAPPQDQPSLIPQPTLQRWRTYNLIEVLFRGADILSFLQCSLCLFMTPGFSRLSTFAPIPEVGTLLIPCLSVPSW